MAKDSYWFRHDSTAGRGLKMRKIAHIYKHWGKGIYWDVIEVLRDQEDYIYSNKETDLQMLCDLIGCKDENKFLSWYKDAVKFDLLQEDENYFFSGVLIENMEKWETKKANGGKGGRPKKTESKANRNLSGNRNESIREDNITGDNTIQTTEELRTELANNFSFINSQCRLHNAQDSEILRLLDKFLLVTYEGQNGPFDFNEIQRHFKNWVQHEDINKIKKEPFKQH